MTLLGRTGLLLALAASCAGCSFAPAYQVPATPVVLHYKEAADTSVGDWAPSQPGDDKPRGEWWTRFGDAQLDALEERALAANQNLRIAEARYRQARAVAEQAGAQLFPLVDLSASAARVRSSANVPRINPDGPLLGKQFDLRAQLSYELDFWGRVRNAADSARSEAQASAADLETARLSLQTELAADWFALRGLDAQIALLESSLASFADALRVTENRYRGGAAVVGDVDQATTQVENARVQLGATRQQRALLEHALAILLGEPASNVELPTQALDLEPPTIATGLASQLLERRPDVAAAERRVAAANAQIGVTRAAWFPSFSLDAAFGFASTRGGNWLSAPSRLWSIGPQVALPLFDGGLRRALNDQALAAYDEAAANYRQTVLTAFGDVEDQLAAIHWLDEQRQSQARAVESSGRALQQATYRYKGGIVSYLEVTTAQNTALQARQADLNLRVQRLGAAVRLVKALGGDWDAERLRQTIGEAPAARAQQTP